MNRKRIGILALLTIVSVCATAAFAGGPLIIFDPATRTPYAYPVGVVDVYTDLGNNGVMTNAFDTANHRIATPSLADHPTLAGLLLDGGYYSARVSKIFPWTHPRRAS